MSRNINVNPGQYKVKGRERQGEDIAPPVYQANLNKMRQQRVPKKKKTKKR
jgi:hypothetical protein